MTNIDELTPLLDTIYALRSVAAHEATVIAGHLTLKTFPASRRKFAEAQILRLQDAAAGHADRAYAGTSHLSLDAAFKHAGGVIDHEWFEDEDVNRANNEIRQLRRGLAYEAAVVNAHLGHRFPKGRAKVADTQVARLRLAATDTHAAYRQCDRSTARHALEDAAGTTLLTVSSWLAEAPVRRQQTS